MAKKSNLPAVVHDHFRKANILHTYVVKSLGEATAHALETGQELSAAKKLIPHGGWETECGRLFDGSPRTAQFYMAFTRDFGQLKSAGKSALLMLEGTLDGAAKAAKKATKPKAKPPTTPPKPAAEPIDVPSEPVDEEETPEPPKRTGKPPKQFDKSHWFKQWQQAIGPVVRLVDKIAAEHGNSKCDSQKVVQDHLQIATEEMQEWMGVE